MPTAPSLLPNSSFFPRRQSTLLFSPDRISCLYLCALNFQRYIYYLYPSQRILRKKHLPKGNTPPKKVWRSACDMESL
jgi:hypothetical protein